MRTPNKFVNPLTDAQRHELNQLMKTGTEAVRRRAHAVLLSVRGYSVDQIADLYEVDRDTVSRWLDTWEDQGHTGLPDQAGRGRRPILNEKEQKEAIKLVEKDPRSVKRSLLAIEAKTGKAISADTLKRLLKKAGKTWKRLRRRPRGKRDEAEFRAAQQDLAEFRAAAAARELDLYYFDGAGFSLDPCVPYAWQSRGQTFAVPAATSDRLQVLAFFSLDHRLHPLVFENSPITSEVVIACFDSLCPHLTRPTIVVLDNAPVQTSAAFLARLDGWEAQGLYVYPLPPYSPELNLIEILWRMMKYHWLPLKAYESFKTLRRALCDVLKGIGSIYQINFAH